MSNDRAAPQKHAGARSINWRRRTCSSNTEQKMVELTSSRTDVTKLARSAFHCRARLGTPRPSSRVACVLLARFISAVEGLRWRGIVQRNAQQNGIRPFRCLTNGRSYSLDVFAPVINLHARDVWRPPDSRRGIEHLERFVSLLGWFLVPLGVAYIAGLVK